MITNPINASCLKDYQTITIGRQMEDNHRQFVFDCSGFDEEVTSIELVHQRSEDTGPYPVTTASTDTLTWTVTDTDTAYAGDGRAELRIRFANGMAKTAVFKTSVIASITGDTVIPDPLQSWYDALIEYIDEHAASPEQIEAAVEAYLDEHPIPAPVTSVNAQTGAVVLDASDVGAYEKPAGGIPKTDLSSDVQASLNRADTALQSAPVTSVNNKTGAVTITAQDLGALTTESDPIFSASPAAGITAQDITSWDNKSDFSGSYTDLTNKPTIPAAGLPAGGSTGQVLTKTSGSDYAAAWQTVSGGGSVDSVNGQTGVVVLDADDVGALPDSTVIPSKTSDLTNDSGYLTSAVTTFNGQSGAVTYSAPVTSVNGQTGAVTLSIPTVPTNVSAFTNDAGYLTQHQSLTAYQTKAITDTGGYFTTDTVEAALQEIGAEIAGINTLIGTGVIS